MSTSVGYTLEKYMGRWRSKEEYKILEAVLSSNPTVSLFLRNSVLLCHLTEPKEAFTLLFSSIGFLRSKLRVVFGPSIVVDDGFEIWIYPLEREQSYSPQYVILMKPRVYTYIQWRYRRNNFLDHWLTQRSSSILALLQFDGRPDTPHDT